MTSKDTSVPSWVDSDAQAASAKAESSSAKPRFVPKVPVKKEKTDAVVVVENGTAKLEKPVTEKNNADKFRNKGRDFEGGRGSSNRNSNYRPGQGRGGGRGQWVMPTGTAFFTGNATAPLPAVPAAKPDNVFRISRPNEVVAAPVQKKSSSSSSTSSEDKKDEAFDSAKIAAMYAARAAANEYDSDDVPDEDEELPEGAEEAWPPVAYDPKAPLSLPLGPKTANMRLQLAAEPILANPNDKEGLLKEESSSLFLLQMPSDLYFDRILESRKYVAGDGSGESGPAKRLVDGKLGKLQLLSNGRVRLVTESGLTYQVSSGLAASFSQTLAAVEVRDDPTMAAAQPVSSSSSTSTKASQLNRLKKGGGGGASAAVDSGEPVLDPSKTGDIHFMGNITKKLVIAPEYEIGTKKSKVKADNGNGRNGSNRLGFDEEDVEEAVDMTN